MKPGTKIRVKVKARARQDCVEPAGDGRLRVWVKAVPEKGRANAAVIEALGEYLGIPRARIRLVTGQTSSEKVFEIH